jgi:hypothetical protein
MGYTRVSKTAVFVCISSQGLIAEKYHKPSTWQMLYSSADPPFVKPLK